MQTATIAGLLFLLEVFEMSAADFKYKVWAPNASDFTPLHWEAAGFATHSEALEAAKQIVIDNNGTLN